MSRKYNIYNENKEFQNISILNDKEVEHLINHFGYYVEEVEQKHL